MNPLTVWCFATPEAADEALPLMVTLVTDWTLIQTSLTTEEETTCGPHSASG
jgi:hypothetical protein